METQTAQKQAGLEGFSLQDLQQVDKIMLASQTEMLEPAQQQAGLEEFSPQQLKQVDAIIAWHAGKPGALIPVLEQVQNILGYLPQSVQMLVAEGLGIPVAKVYGVVTFYSFFTMVPRGRHTIRVCLGTACYVRGAQRLLARLQEILEVKPGGCTEDRRFSLETVRCLGACGLAPVIVVNETTHGQMKPGKLESVLALYK